MPRNRQTVNDTIDRLKRNIAEQKRRQAKETLLDFTVYTFPEYQVNWHHRLICREIDDWIKADDPYNLMLSMPPRHGKSELCSRRLPAYILGKNPNAQVLAASYSGTLIESMSRDCQKIMITPEYRSVFPDTQLSTRGNRPDEMAIRRAEEFTVVNRRGHYRCAGIGGSMTGRGGDFAIVDDPVKDRQDAESDTKRDTCIEWYTSVMRTRMEKGGRILLLMTRWHTDDLAGWAIKKMKDDPDADPWKVIVFPAIFEKTEYTHPEDPRKKGEALWPNKADVKDLKRSRATLTKYEWAGLYQQRPTPSGGAVIKREWLQIIEPDKVPVGMYWVRYWDLAVSKKTSADYTASGQMAFDRDMNIYVRRFLRDRTEWPETRRSIVNIGINERVAVGIETCGTQQGFFQDLLATTAAASIPLVAYNEDKDKLTRALPWVARCEAGKFYMIRGNGLDKCIDELVEFTGQGDSHDDQVDWISGAYRMLTEYVEPKLEVLGDYA